MYEPVRPGWAETFARASETRPCFRGLLGRPSLHRADKSATPLLAAAVAAVAENFIWFRKVIFRVFGAVTFCYRCVLSSFSAGYRVLGVDLVGFRSIFRIVRIFPVLWVVRPLCVINLFGIIWIFSRIWWSFPWLLSIDWSAVRRCHDAQSLARRCQVSNFTTGQNCFLS